MLAPDAKPQTQTWSQTAACTTPKEDLAPLYRQFHAQLQRWTATHVGSLEEAEDIVQNVFLSMCRRGGTDQVRGDVRAYLFGITRKLIAQYFRQKRQKPEAAQIEWLDELPAQPSCDQNQLQIEQIKGLLERLAPKSREALKLRYVIGMRPKEAAEHIGCSRNVFYQRVHSAVETLRTYLDNGAGTQCRVRMKGGLSWRESAEP